MGVLDDEEPSEREYLHGVAVETTGGSACVLLGDFDAWCAAREWAAGALEQCVRDARCESGGDSR